VRDDAGLGPGRSESASHACQSAARRGAAGGPLRHGDLLEAVDAAELIVEAVPSHGFRPAACGRAAAAAGAPVVSATKGLEIGTLLRMSEVARPSCPGGRSPSCRALVRARGRARAADHGGDRLPRRRRRGARAEGVVDAPSRLLERGRCRRGARRRAEERDRHRGGHRGRPRLWPQHGRGRSSPRGLAEITPAGVAPGGRGRTRCAGLAGLGTSCSPARGPSRGKPRARPGARARAALGTRRSGHELVAEGVRTTLAACALGERARRRDADRAADARGAATRARRRARRSTS
jgi:glycerol-3-phosphate dehydrogenase (NAD(P)+)